MQRFSVVKGAAFVSFGRKTDKNLWKSEKKALLKRPKSCILHNDPNYGYL